MSKRRKRNEESRREKRIEGRKREKQRQREGVLEPDRGRDGGRMTASEARSTLPRPKQNDRILLALVRAAGPPTRHQALWAMKETLFVAGKNQTGSSG